MLHVEHIHKTFFAGTINEKVALQDLSLHLAPGDFVTVIGGNGALILPKRRNINVQNISAGFFRTR